MTPRFGLVLAALGAVGAGACDPPDAGAGHRSVADLVTPGTATLMAAPVAVARPFGGYCSITVVPRVHDDSGGCGGGCGGEDEGNCGGEEGDEGGGPPIGRHFDLAGTCNLTHLGLSRVTGRLNLSGPFGTEGEAADGHGVLGARGRLVFVAANGEQLVGRYIPIQAVFSRDTADGGTVTFTSTEQFGLKCSDPGGGSGGHGEAEDSSTGRFTGATGSSPFGGTLRIRRSSGGGAGNFTFSDGTVSY